MKNIDEIVPIEWTKKSYRKFVKDIENYKDLKYLEFNKRTVCTGSKMIGIRIPILRKIASKIKRTDYMKFLEVVDDSSFEALFLHGVVLSFIEDFRVFKKYFDLFIEKIDNWAICDMCLTKLEVVRKNKEEMLKSIKQYLKSEKEFIIRAGIILIMYYYIDDKYIDQTFEVIRKIDSKYYYVNMATAWLLSELFIGYRELVLNNLNKFSNTVINMCISKIRDSRRVSEEDKIVILKYKKKTA